MCVSPLYISYLDISVNLHCNYPTWISLCIYRHCLSHSVIIVCLLLGYRCVCISIIYLIIYDIYRYYCLSPPPLSIVLISNRSMEQMLSQRPRPGSTWLSCLLCNYSGCFFWTDLRHPSLPPAYSLSGCI